MRDVADSVLNRWRWMVARWIDHVVEVVIHPVLLYLSCTVFPCQPDHSWTYSSRKCYLVLVLMSVRTKGTISVNATRKWH